MEIEMEELDKWMNSLKRNVECEYLPPVKEEKDLNTNPRYLHFSSYAFERDTDNFNRSKIEHMTFTADPNFYFAYFILQTLTTSLCRLKHRIDSHYNFPLTVERWSFINLFGEMCRKLAFVNCLL
ncbi:transmembrane protein 154 [Hemicordylus capensis]|uniref:transmembrane protein 154 n=1 Tax=Hemicordylus capensis TaxID=884348 RepID=UPI002302ED84|nr:transmembrane protein 154 [Hemicordylus capensis]